MAQTGYTPISLYYSATASAAPTAGNLVAGELAINTNDGVIYYKDSSGVVQSIASKASNSGSFTNLAYTGTLTGGTGVVNLGSGQFYKDSSGNVGIGTSSPTTKLNVGGAYPTGYNSTLSQFVGSNVVQANGTGMVSISTNNATGADLGGSLGFGSYDSSISSPYPCAVISGRRESGTAGTYSGYFAVATTLSNGTIAERMRIDSSGNVGIGTNSPAVKLQVNASSDTVARFYNNTANSYIQISDNNGTNNASFGSIASGNAYMFSAGYNAFYAGNTERMRIDSNGDVLIGVTSSVNGGNCMYVPNGTCSTIWTGQSTSINMIVFRNANGNIGSITTSGTSTSYNTSSDYRLKNITGNLTGYKERILALQPKQGTWKTDGSKFAGFLAHEFANQYPSFVNGKKDAVDAEGNPQYQGIQAGNAETIADLVALAQEQQAMIEELKAKVAALEAA